jgi:hypothetical protein
MYFKKGSDLQCWKKKGLKMLVEQLNRNMIHTRDVLKDFLCVATMDMNGAVRALFIGITVKGNTYL